MRLFFIALAAAGLKFLMAPTLAAQPAGPGPDQQFAQVIQPLLKSYCYSCHGETKQEAKLKLSSYGTVAAVAKNAQVWDLVRQRLEAGEMPPDDARERPTTHERRALIEWIESLLQLQASQNAGDPGQVLARRLSNSELDYTIRDLTGVDIRPTRQFPVDPANEAGFDNSGESLAMSPELLKKYLAAARLVAEHVVLKPQGFVFAPHPAVTETDRDKYCVHRIIDFYRRHEVDLADYFLASWKYHHRKALGKPDADLRDLAADRGLSEKYLAAIWAVLNDNAAEAGPLSVVRTMWRGLPAPETGHGQEPLPTKECERIRDIVQRMRKELTPEFGKIEVKGISPGSQPFVLWRNRQSAAQHMRYTGSAVDDAQLLENLLKESDPALAAHIALDKTNSEAVARFRAACERFCHDFPGAFVVSDRGPYFDPKQAGKGRHLTAGFHLMQGYFRDDEPLMELVLDEAGRRELDALWQELNFITLVPMRQYKDFIFFERAEPPRFMREAEFDFARSEDKDSTSAAKMSRLAEAHLAKARKIGASAAAVEAIETYYTNISAEIRWVEEARLAAEPSHLAALTKFAERAYRRPLGQSERDELLAFYRSLRDKDGLGHEQAIRDALASVLLSPHFCYRLDLPQPGTAVQPLSDYALASRLSYFLWSSMPDQELLDHAAAGDLHRREVLRSQTRRMLRDPKIRGLAVEFGGNWLDIRRFEEHNSVDRQRFGTFTPELRAAMFEEPIRFFVDVVQHDRPVLEFLYADHTLVNPLLAKHYGMQIPEAKPDQWVRVDEASRYGRGGLLPMAVFLTKNSPGLRTSPVKRGYWVVRRLLGERIPAPPPNVPELPQDEAKLGELSLPQLLARHRADKSCAPCHQRFDSIGLTFEGYGPIGERRETDLGGRPVQTLATFPDASEGEGLEGLRRYLRDQRHDEFVDNLCRKLLSYALGRSLIVSDRKMIDDMKTKLAADGYAMGSLIESIVTSPQFTSRRGRDDPRSNSDD
jgi:hypothetical protein